jgi:pectate lyase
MRKKAFLAGFIAVLCLCLTSNAFAIEADGWATVSDANGTPYNITGGAGGETVTVTDEPNLIKYAKDTTTSYIVQISGTINVLTVGGEDDSFEINSNKTLIGIGENPTIVGNTGFINRGGNIIIENLNFTNPHSGDAYDGISLKQQIHNVLVTKCTFYDCGDGTFDITNGTDFVTVSWCKFYYGSSPPNPDHLFSCLVGHSDTESAAAKDRGHLCVTYHHNWWANRVKERMPRVRFGKVHIYNNYYSNLETGGYCIGVGVESNIRVENNYFNAVYTPWKDYYTGTGYAAGHIGWNDGNDGNNIYYNCTRPSWATNEYDTIFTPPYSYALDDASILPAVVPAFAGAGTPYPPHWYSTVYGDFDISGKVDMDDLGTFGEYWLTGDLEADYDADGIVDFYEFALLAENWML